MSKPWRTSKLREVRKWEATWPKNPRHKEKRESCGINYFFVQWQESFYFNNPSRSKPCAGPAHGQVGCKISSLLRADAFVVPDVTDPAAETLWHAFLSGGLLLSPQAFSHGEGPAVKYCCAVSTPRLFTSAAVFKKETLTCVQLSLAACSSCAICGNSWKTCLCFFNACRKRNFATDRLPSLSLLSPRKKANKFCQSLVLPASPQLVYAASSWPEQTQLIFYVKLNLLSMVYVVADSSIYNSNQFITQQFRKVSVKSPHNFFINLVRIIQDWEWDGGLPLLIINLFPWRCPPVAL